jgi:hypothetical protein
MPQDGEHRFEFEAMAGGVWPIIEEALFMIDSMRVYCDDRSCPSAASCALHWKRSEVHGMRPFLIKYPRDPSLDHCFAYVPSDPSTTGALVRPEGRPGLIQRILEYLLAGADEQHMTTEQHTTAEQRATTHV